MDTTELIKNEIPARNLTMLTDFYELTMSNGYLEHDVGDKIAVFDMFFRTIPDDGGFALFAGLEQLIEYLNNLSFTEKDIEYLRSKHQFSEKFLEYLTNFKFECDVWSVEEGTPMFPNEPIIVVRGPMIQAQLIETMVLLTINHQSLVATKSNRICRAAQNRSVFEFGSRRAQSYDAAILGARAAYIGGCDATACTISDRDYRIPAVGTMAHSWVQMFDSEYDAFKKYAEVYPENCTLLVDTYNVLGSGIPNAIKVFNEVLLPKGYKPKGVRIDSGDLAYLSKKARKMLDDAGFDYVNIVASNSLDEIIIRDLLLQGAKIDLFGVGENLITSASDPVFGGVYKLVAVKRPDGTYQPKMKCSDSASKAIIPGKKMPWRLYDENGQAQCDLIAMDDEVIEAGKPITMVNLDSDAIERTVTITPTKVRKLLVPHILNGQLAIELPSIAEKKAYIAKQLTEETWESELRLECPHKHYVNMTPAVAECRSKMYAELHGGKV